MGLPFFYLLAAFTVGTALVVIFQRSPVSAAMALVASFFGIALLFVTLHAHFVAVMQLLLYAGAIMVFFVFVIMLLNLEATTVRWRAVAGNRLVLGSAAFYLLGLFLFLLFWQRKAAVQLNGTSDVAAGVDLPEGSVEAVGQLLLSKYVVPFEVASIVLFAAIVGAVVMGKRKI